MADVTNYRDGQPAPSSPFSLVSLFLLPSANCRSRISDDDADDDDHRRSLLRSNVRRNRTSIVIKIIPAFAATRQIKRDRPLQPRPFSRPARIIPGVIRDGNIRQIDVPRRDTVILELFVEEGRIEIIAITMRRMCNARDATVISCNAFAAWY